MHENEITSYDFYPEPIWIKIEGVVNKYPRRIFRESTVFQDMLGLPRSENLPEEGSNQSCPLVLESVKLKAFIQFARVIEAHNQENGLPSLSIECWLDILHLCDRWAIESMHVTAIEQLTALFKEPAANPAVQLRTGFDYEMSDWKLAGLEKLIARERPLDAADIDCIGSKCAAYVMSRREICAKNIHGQQLKEPGPDSMVRYLKSLRYAWDVREFLGIVPDLETRSDLLQPGILQRIICASDDDAIHQSQPILQILTIKPITTSTLPGGQERYRGVISDGLHYIQAMFATQLNGLVRDGTIQKQNIIRMTQYSINIVKEMRLTIILNFDLIEKCAETIGDPQPLVGP